ncbi:MAG: RNA polymerase subunit sigma [Planctomycetaceae bacterium]|nr:RNA polymerase subunit sigma [Planctomycetaceae bacterium]
MLATEDQDAMESSDRTAEFVRLLQQHERQVAVYIHSLVPSWSDAEDVLQETSVRLWEQFDRFEPGTSFGAWACTVARYMVLAYREKTGRDRLQFDADLLERIAREVDRSAGANAQRAEALVQCLDEVSETNRQLLALCYASDLRIKDVAERIKRSANATYIAVSRVRKWLHECITRRTAQV